MMKTLILAIAGLVMVTAQSPPPFLTTVGLNVAAGNVGFCLGMQDNPTDTTTTCYSAC